jgi:hypothetical protein
MVNPYINPHYANAIHGSDNRLMAGFGENDPAVLILAPRAASAHEQYDRERSRGKLVSGSICFRLLGVLQKNHLQFLGPMLDRYATISGRSRGKFVSGSICFRLLGVLQKNHLQFLGPMLDRYATISGSRILRIE